MQKQLLGLLLLNFIFNSHLSWGATLKLEQVAKIYIQENEVLKSLKAEIEAADYDEKEASRNLWPSISWNSSLVDQQVPVSMYGGFDIAPKKIYSSALSFQQPLYLGGKIWNAWSMRKQTLEMAKLKYLDQQQQLLMGVTLKAVNLHTSQKMKEVLLESQKIQKQFWDIVSKRALRGASKDYEVAQAEGDYYSYVAKIQQQDSLIESLRAQLAEELSLESATDLNIEVQMPNPNEKSKIETLDRPDILLAKKQVEMAETNKSLALGDHYPSVLLSGTWGYQAKERDELFDEDSKQHNVALSLSIPIFSGFTSLAVRRASESRITAAKLQYKYLQDQGTMELKNSEQKLEIAKQVLNANKKWSQQALLAVQKGLASYKLGVISTFQMVQLQRGYEGAALSYWNSLLNFYSEKLNWLKMKGQPIAENL